MREEPPRSPTNLSQLESLDLPALRREWSRLLGTNAPTGRSRELLLRGIAWRLQEIAQSGLSAKVRQHLSRLTQAMARNPDYRVGASLKPGTVLLREWKGQRHEVRVLEQGFAYGEACYGSLSEIARIITGTRWNGIVFFGLKKKNNGGVGDGDRK